MEEVWPLPPDPAAWALFLDIDGTLLDIAPTPEGVIIPATLPPLLDSLTRRLSGALALISGRSLADIDRLFPQRTDAAGIHGAEWRMSGKSAARTDDRGQDLVPDDLVTGIETQARLLPGVLVERKPRSVALHYRSAPEHATAVHALAEAAVRRAPSPLRLLRGKAVIELIPAGAGKGKAIEQFMQTPPYAGRTPVFVGDDVTDEDGFITINRMGGISIYVGGNPTAARCRFSSPAAVRQWLAMLNDRLSHAIGNERTA